MVDSDLIIDYLRGKGSGAALVRELISGKALRVAAVTAFELRLGTDFLDRRDEILRLLRSRTLPFDLASAMSAGAIYSLLSSSGQKIGMADCLIAGTCVRHNLPLASRNTRHFERVDGLKLFHDEATPD